MGEKGDERVKWGRARKKPVEIEYREVEPKTLIRVEKPEGVEVWGEAIETLEGTLFAYPGEHYIIRGVEGEVYPIRKDIFYRTYDVIESPEKE